MVKAELARRINNIIKKRGITQTEAADILGLDQPKVSLLNQGRLSIFSTDRLIRCLNALGQDVEIVVKPKPRSRAKARLRVVAA